MTTPSQPRAIDHARTARIVLAMISHDIPKVNAVLAETQADQTVHLLIATLTQHVIAAMKMPAKTDAEIIAALEGVVAVEQLETGEDG